MSLAKACSRKVHFNNEKILIVKTTEKNSVFFGKAGVAVPLDIIRHTI
jgi:hypothetical protein